MIPPILPTLTLSALSHPNVSTRLVLVSFSFTLIAPDGSKAQPGKKHKTNLLKHPAYSNNNFGNDWAEGGRECMGGLAGAA
jgi:hypothetical protein